jgi:nitrite reductase (NADH) small subunit
MNWIQITETANIPEKEGRTVDLGSLSVAIFNLGDRFAAVENRCPHKGGPLADGIVGGTTVTKPCAGENSSVRTFDVKVENGLVMLAVEPAEWNAQAA